ncbi:MAG: biopolymer transporter ExbD [Ignavibacteriales bacterium]|nr:biopolymer transporter ExbD [Ignavibacteriales bacterium]
MKFEVKNKPLSIFNFSSLTDIVLLLLIFFLLTSQFVIQTGVKVKLPGSKNDEQVTTSRFVVAITENQEVYLGPKMVTVETLAGELSLILTENEDPNLIIRADKTVDIDLVIKVIDAAKGIGINKFTIETEKEPF